MNGIAECKVVRIATSKLALGFRSSARVGRTFFAASELAGDALLGPRVLRLVRIANMAFQNSRILSAEQRFSPLFCSLVGVFALGA